jgi:hypothetical protein
MKVSLMCNGAHSPVQLERRMPAGWQNDIYLGKRLTANIAGTDEEQAAIRAALKDGYKLEFWIMAEL